MSGSRVSRPSIWTTGFDGVQYPGPTVTCILAAALSLVFAALWWSNAVTEDATGYAAYLVGGLHVPSVQEGEVFRIFTSPFLHLEPYHFMMNLGALLGLTAVLEAQIGHARTLLVAALSMLAGSIATVAVPPTGTVLVGASGAIFGMLGAWGTLALRQRRSLPPLLRRVRWAIPVALVADTALVFLFPAKIGWIAHLGGLAGGMAAMALLSRGAGPIPLGPSPRWMRWVAAGLTALFLWAVVVDVQRVASGRICEVLLRDDLSEAVREGFTAALGELPVTCASPEAEPEAPPATPADSGTPERPRTRSSANRRGP
jgi:membrane associated rhomboid family serine protease